MTGARGSEARPSVSAWRWPIDAARYDRRPALTAAELAGLTALGAAVRRWRWRTGRGSDWASVERLVRPLADARAALEVASGRQGHLADAAVGELLLECVTRQQAFWGWSAAMWVAVLGCDQRAFFAAHPRWDRGDLRQPLIGLAYLLGGLPDLRPLGQFERVTLARKVFGRVPTQAAITAVEAVLGGWGYRDCGTGRGVARTLCLVLLHNRSPRLEDLTVGVLDDLRPDASPGLHALLHQIQRSLATLGILPAPAAPPAPPAVRVGGDPQWSDWVGRWEATSTLAPHTRRHMRGDLLKAGRWLAATHPLVREPAQWTRAVCAAYVAAIDRMRVGDFVARADVWRQRAGHPLSARSKDGYLGAARQFFRDCQEWEWMPRRFDPSRALATPRSVKALIGPDPRVIADDRWAKLLWAGLNFQSGDLPPGRFYPVELIRALGLAWLFSGLRSNEIVRLRVGCVRWQTAGGTDREPSAVCLLDVPSHKTGTPFTKPVDTVLGEALLTWAACRPEQPPAIDRRTGESVALLFSYRAKPVATQYLNQSVIPALCRKAGVPVTDARGRITSHRARATIASQLYNAKEPMTLVELQTWLGHRSPASTQHYARITPTTLAKAYADAGYFARNVRAIAVLIDRDAVETGATAGGHPWQYFDLGHGYCTYSFFEQ
ncbi:MAG TPA: site-specific integrase, partial [Verrucomicrobiae bacterium]|nr:site-specific integrase [Verrucomicrobiae bacterium]